METIPHIPALRLGRSYESLDHTEALDCRTSKAVVTISQVNAGILRKDLARIQNARAALKKFTVAQLIEICSKAGELFLHGTLPLGDKGHTQSPQGYVEMLSATSGLPYTLARRNMQRIHSMLASMDMVLRGLTRGLDLDVIDRGMGKQSGATVSFRPSTQCLGVVMPSNSPAVNSLWLPAIALKIPVIIKPGGMEPLTPYRLIQAFIAAGCPAEAFGFYPTDHEGAQTLLRSCGRALMFGDKSTVDQYANNPAIQVHGPGHSKILFGTDALENWQQHIDLLVSSIADNGGRSCLNASTIVVPSHADEIAGALAKRLGPVMPLPLTDEQATLSAFANPKMAEYIDGAIEEGLKTPGAEEVTTKFRNGPRQVTLDGAVYLRPTIVRCDSFQHPLANREFLFPYASVVEIPQEAMLEQIGSSLVVTAITRDDSFVQQLLECPLIDRLNIGPISTMKISWDQPHEGNLFEFLYKRRAIERV